MSSEEEMARLKAELAEKEQTLKSLKDKVV